LKAFAQISAELSAVKKMIGKVTYRARRFRKKDRIRFRLEASNRGALEGSDVFSKLRVL
jgi:hypothetical protein